MTDLSDFLLARIAEDEQSARAASFLRPSGPDPAFVSLADGLLRMQQRFDSPRVLAECDAKRRIVEQETPTPWVVNEELRPGWTNFGENERQATAATIATMRPEPPSRVLRLLALPYADHPDYRDEWRP